MKLATTTSIVDGVEIKGRAAFGFDGFPAWFAKYLDECEDYLEIGTLFGGTAVLAGLHVSGKVYCIDPLDGYYKAGQVDSHTGLVPSPEIVRENWKRAGLDQDRLVIFQHKHPPFPDVDKFDIAFIDGDHTKKGCKADWLAVKGRAKKYIVFDNLERDDVYKVFEEAQQDKNWKKVEVKRGHIETGGPEMVIGVLERV